MTAEALKHQQNKSITGSAAWNHTLAKLSLKQLQFTAQIVLTSALSICLCVRVNWTLHRALWEVSLFRKRDWVKEKKRVKDAEYPSPVRLICSPTYERCNWSQWLKLSKLTLQSLCIKYTETGPALQQNMNRLIYSYLTTLVFSVRNWLVNILKACTPCTPSMQHEKAFRKTSSSSQQQDCSNHSKLNRCS